VGQVLAAIKMQLESLGSIAPAGAELFRENACQSAERLGEVLTGLRILADELRPPALDAAGLPLTLRSLCDRMAEHTGLTIQYASTGCDDLSLTEAIHLYRFVQEGLVNAARYARAKNIRVNLCRELGRITATVEDDGQGFDPHAIRAIRVERGESLAALQEKLRLLGGNLEILSQRGQGTRLIAHRPEP
jgi:signal transduction histidine kinase